MNEQLPKELMVSRDRRVPPPMTNCRWAPSDGSCSNGTAKGAPEEGGQSTKQGSKLNAGLEQVNSRQQRLPVQRRRPGNGLLHTKHIKQPSVPRPWTAWGRGATRAWTAGGEGVTGARGEAGDDRASRKGVNARESGFVLSAIKSFERLLRRGVPCGNVCPRQVSRGSVWGGLWRDKERHTRMPAGRVTEPGNERSGTELRRGSTWAERRGEREWSWRYRRGRISRP